MENYIIGASIGIAAAFLLRSIIRLIDAKTTHELARARATLLDRGEDSRTAK